MLPGNSRSPEERDPAGSIGLRRPLAARIGKYQVEAESEAGHRARVRVFRALDRDTGRPVTLKLLADVADRPLTDRFRREVATVAKLRSASLTAIYELGEHVGLPFAAMQHLGDDHLGRAIKSQRYLTLLQKVLIMWHVAEGARAAHRGGLPYVGIRPSGIALSNDGGAILQDFGIVRLNGGEPEERILYSSPEEFASEFPADSLCDIFAFGAVYYELLTGTHPFLAGSSTEAMIGILHREPFPLRELMPDCPEALERLVCRSLDKRRELRYQSFDEVQDDAEPILQELKRARAASLSAGARRLVGTQESDELPGATREPSTPAPEAQNGHHPLSAEARDLLQDRIVRLRLELMWKQADEEAAARHFGRAADILKSALRIEPDNSEAKERLDRMIARMEESERAAKLVAEARRLLDQNQLQDAHNKVLEALERDPQNPEATELLGMVFEGLERRAREARAEEELERAKSLLLLQSFDEALSILVELRADSADPWLIEQWIAHVQSQKQEAERRDRLEQQANEARALLEQQRFAEAAALLEVACAESPEDATLQNLLSETREALERASAIAEAIARCNQLLQESDVDGACQVLDDALVAYPGEAALLALQREVEEQRESLQLAAAVRQALDEVEWLLEQDRPDLAVRFLRDKSADLGDEPSLAARLVEIEKLLPDWEQRRFVRFIQEYSMGRVEALEQLEQWPVALTVLEEALVACPASGEMVEAADRLRRRLQEQDRRKKLARRLEAIGQKMAVQAWSQALLLIEAAQREFPGEPELQAALEKAQDGWKRSECESLAAEVRQHLADGATD